MMKHHAMRIAAPALLLALVVGAGAQPGEKANKLRPEKCGTIKNLHVLGKLYFAGQPDKGDFALLKKKGVQTVVNLRTAKEMPFDEADIVKQLGMAYYHIPIAGPESLTDEVFAQTRRLFNDRSKHPMLVHCASANRVGAVWLAHRVLDDGVSYEQALKEAQEIGLSNVGMEKRVREYIERQKKK